MIRVNLLRNVIETAEASKGESKFGTLLFRRRAAGAAVSIGGQLDIILKVLVLVVPIVGFFVYDQVMISIREKEISDAKAHLEEVRRELESSKEEIKIVEKFKAEQKKISGRIETVRDLSRERMRIIKALDGLQSLIPAKAWMSKVLISPKKGANGVNIMPEFEITGLALDEFEISTFMQSLEENAYFAGVSLVSANQSRTADGLLKQFKIMGTLEGY